MNFELDDVQQQLSDSVNRLLGDHYDFAARSRYAAEGPGYSRSMWQRFADLGLLALPFAEAEGGLGLGAAETMIVMEAFGRALVVEPYLATVVMAGGAIRHGAGDHQRATLLASIGEGTRVMAFAHSEPRARYNGRFVETRARVVNGHWLLNGEKTLVLHGDTADTFLVSARVAGLPTDKIGIALFVVEAPDVARRGYATQDGMRAAEISLRDVKCQPIGEPGAAWTVIEQVTHEAISALCAEAVGAMSAVLDMTVEYLKVRRQFGAPIGSFQVLAHRAAEMAIAVEQARSMAFYTTMMVSSNDPTQRARAVHAAKAQIGQSGKFVGEQAVQLHGGIGMTDEYAVAHYLKRLSMIERAFGDSGYHLAALAGLGGLPI